MHKKYDTNNFTSSINSSSDNSIDSSDNSIDNSISSSSDNSVDSDNSMDIDIDNSIDVDNSIDANYIDDNSIDDNSINGNSIDDNSIVSNMVSDFKKVSFFGDEEKFMELYNNSKLEIQDFEYQEEIEQVLNKTLKRYNIYLKDIGYMNNNIKKDLEHFIKQFNDYKYINDTELFRYMNYIDNNILNKIASSKHPKYWL